MFLSTFFLSPLMLVLLVYKHLRMGEQTHTLKLDCLIYHLLKSICIDQQCLPLTQASKEKEKKTKQKTVLNANSIVLIPPEA